MKILKFANLILLVLFITAGASGETLKRVAPALEVFEPDASHIFYAADVPVSVLKSLAKIPAAQLKSETFPSIYKMPLGGNLYLVTVTRNQGTESEYVLFKEENGALNELQRSAAIENTIVKTTFFIGKNRTLIVADTAVPPDFAGLEIFDFTANKLSYLGELSVAEKDKPTGLDGDFVSPVPKMSVELKSDVYYLTITGNLYSDWGDEQTEKKAVSPMTYFYNGKTFELWRRKAKC